MFSLCNWGIEETDWTRDSSTLSRYATHAHSPTMVQVNSSTSARSLETLSVFWRAQNYMVLEQVSPAATRSFKGSTARIITSKSQSPVTASTSSWLILFTKKSHFACACVASAASDLCLAVNSSIGTRITQSCSTSALVVCMCFTNLNIRATLDTASDRSQEITLRNLVSVNSR